MSSQLAYNRYRMSGLSGRSGRPERLYQYVPGAFQLTELFRKGQRSVEIQQGRSLVSAQDVQRTLGFGGKVLSAVSLGRETFWIVDIRGSVEPQRPDHWSVRRENSYEVKHRSGATVDLGSSGVVVVHPRTWGMGSETKPGFLPLYRSRESSGTFATVVDGHGKGENTALSGLGVYSPARGSLDLPEGFPTNGFVVRLEASPLASRPDLSHVYVTDLGTGNGGDVYGEQTT